MKESGGIPSASAVTKFRIRALRAALTTTWPPHRIGLLLWRLIFPAREKPVDILYSSPPRQSNLLIFAHFSDNGTVDDYVLFLLSALNKVGFDIIFCSVSPKIDGRKLDKLKELCITIIRRDNIGYDWGSYYAGWQSIVPSSRSAYDYIAFANDSVYGPFGSLDDFWQFVKTTPYEMFGMADSYEHMYHIQSWFLMFKNNAAVGRFLDWFWGNFKLRSDRTIAIFFGEMAMTQMAIESGLRVGAFAPYSKVQRVAEARMNELGYVSHTLCRAVNSTQFYWRILIENFNVPFVKRSLLKQNRYRIPDLDKLPELAKIRGYNTALITDHLPGNKE